MTSIVIMSTIGTTFRSALVARRPWTILPPRTLEAAKRLAGRFPGWTIGTLTPLLSGSHDGDVGQPGAHAGVDGVDEISVEDGVLRGHRDGSLIGEICLELLQPVGEPLHVVQDGPVAGPSGERDLDLGAGARGEDVAALADHDRH